jgi:hypothetical protein
VPKVGWFLRRELRSERSEIRGEPRRDRILQPIATRQPDKKQATKTPNKSKAIWRIIALSFLGVS